MRRKQRGVAGRRRVVGVTGRDAADARYVVIGYEDRMGFAGRKGWLGIY